MVRPWVFPVSWVQDLWSPVRASCRHRLASSVYQASVRTPVHVGLPEGYWAERCTDSILATLEGKCCQPAPTQTRPLRQKTKNQPEATAQNPGRALTTQPSSLANKKRTRHRRVITEDYLLTHVDRNDRHKKELSKRKTSTHLWATVPLSLERQL